VTFREAGIRLAELSVSKPTLDEVFLALTGHGAAPVEPVEPLEPLESEVAAAAGASAADERNRA
ncbi:MAG TPA: hypothetical protein VM430_06100, partial [Microbacterium sp.]|nr:hypothetical protein [Microbacterium sp.]